MIRTASGQFAGLVPVRAALLLAVGVARATETSCRIFVVETPLSSHVIRPDAPLPPYCRESERIEVMAARGEYEPASFVVETTVPMRGVMVQGADLQLASDSSALIPSAAVDVRVVAPVFRYTSDFPATVNWVLVHDPNLIEVRDEPQPRSLNPDASPVDLAFTKTNVFTRILIDIPSLQAADIRSRRQFWLTLHVPSPDRAAAVVSRRSQARISTHRPGIWSGAITPMKR